MSTRTNLDARFWSQMSYVQWWHVNLLWDLAWNDLPGCRTQQLNYLFKREYLRDLAATLHSRYAAQWRGGDMRLHFTGLSHFDLPTLCTHTDAHTNTCLTLCPWFLHLYHQQFSLFHSFLCMWGWSYRFPSLKNATTTYLLISFLFADCNAETHIMLFTFHPASFHPPFIIPHLLPLHPPSTGGDKSHRKGRREIIHQLVTNRTAENWWLSRLIKCMLRQTRRGDR